MTQRAQKMKPPRHKGVDYHQAAQLSALRALALSFSRTPSSCSIRLFAETFLEYVLQIFEADGAYLEFSPSSPAEKIRLAIGSLRDEATWGKVLFSEAKKSARIHRARVLSGTTAIKKAGWDPKTSILATPIQRGNRVSGILALGKSGVPSFFKETDLEELELFTHYLALASKKTSLKKTREEAIQEFSENLEDGIYVIDRNGRALVVNPKGRALLGIHDKEEAIRGLYDDPVLLNIRTARGAIPSPQQLPLARALRGETFSSVEYIIRRPGEESDVHLSLSGGFLYNKKRKVAEGVLVAREITEFKRRERRLQTDLAEQREREQARTTFLSHVSHELKTPLNVIVGYTALLLEERYGRLPEKAKEALSRTRVNAKELAQMIGDLLTLSKLEATKMLVAVEEVDLGALLREVLRDARSLSAEKPIKFLLKVDRDLPLIKSDPAKLKEIFLNLFSNAVKYTLKGSIQVFAKDLPEQRRVRVDVVDTGIGIQEADLFQLFDEFHRVEDPGMRNTPGTGLGLAIVKNMARLLQGSVEVESAYGKGSTFTIFLPYALRKHS
jgi:signal transduction histidine kinase